MDRLPTQSYAAAAAAKELPDVPVNGAPPEQYSGNGENEGPRSPVRRSKRRQISGHSRDKNDSISQLVVEKFQDKDGEHLTTVKQIQRDGQPQTQRSDELVSGRRVGTKWERSQ